MTRILGRHKDHRTHLLRNLGRSLVVHERITTTLPKAKSLRPIVEHWVTRAKKTASSTGSRQLALRRQLLAEVHHSDVASKLINDIALRTKSRAGGYLRIRKLGTRLGDAAPMARIELVDHKLPVALDKSAPAAKSKAKTVKKTAKGPATVTVSKKK